MPERTDYLICYDIGNSRARRSVAQMLQAYAIGKQKSAYLCRLTLAERQLLEQKLNDLLADNDALLLLSLGEHYPAHYLGLAKPWETPFFVVA
ncbi:CRISPR-associated endonuclease Cas2 [Stenoxybacter acetivorans]|uniref:CRISPR-associated endonuclease Cas2 n=1 Tax=Stenoxybacter acetivorans TaxID=422441 RepID=UPI000563F82D|nr:CRISPR-associated endonuclease Cas2 [Stenoxybacter acetivorans]